MKWVWRSLIALLVLIAALALALFLRIRSVKAERVSGDVHMISGLGSNVGVLKTSAGAVVVDSMTFPFQGAIVRERAEALGGGPTELLINTHYHVDHTHGNPGFVAGTRVLSTDRTLHHLKVRDAEFWDGDRARLLPSETFTSDHEAKVGNKTVRAYHVGRGHTDGDLVVLFVEDRVLHTGDLCVNRMYPNIDLEAGGSVREWVGTLDRILAIPFDKVIPGHGAVTDRHGIEAFRRFMAQLAALGAKAAREGWSLEQMQASKELTEDAGFEALRIPGILRLDREFVLRRAWEEATGRVKPDGR